MKLMMFDFKCVACDHAFEKLVPAHDSCAPCPVCGRASDKVMSAPGGFKFVGSGFYETDYKGKK